MDERRVAEYFVVAGLPPNPVPLAEFSCDGANLKSTHSLPPVTDIGVVNRSLGEVVPEGYTCIEYTTSKIIANLNYGVLRSQEIFLCYRRGHDKPPLVDIGVLLEGRERLLPDSQVVEVTVGHHNANINSNGVAVYLTYRRATEESTCNELVVTDICIIMTNKGETAPHSYCTIERNLNKGTMMGADIFMCYRKSVNRTNYLAYKAGILDCYPLEARPNFPRPDNLALFCLPMGATLEAWPPQAKSPDLVFSTFVLTILPSGHSSNQEAASEGVEKVYGAAITFYERYPHDKLTPQQRQDLQLNDHFGRRNIIHTNKCICILSLWPFFDTSEKFLRYLHKMTQTSNHRVPIERFIWHMLECVPFPSARRPRILIQLDSQEGISLAQPEDSPICLSGASFRKLVMCLRPEGCLLVLLYSLTEQKILLHSLRPDVLTAVSEALTMIIFPFRWQCPYIPLCPLGLSDFLDAPTPFLLGLDSRFFDLYDPPTDVICIDLDTAAISIPEDKKHLTTKLLPKKAARILKSSLESLCGCIKSVDEQLQEHHLKPNIMLDQNIDIDFKMKRKEDLILDQNIWILGQNRMMYRMDEGDNPRIIRLANQQELEVEIQETFLRFTATILKGYSLYLLPIVTVKPHEDSGTPVLFDVEGFIRSRERTYQKFYEMLVSTQMFSKFTEERSFVSDKDASLVFFDDCIERIKEDDPSIRLLEVEPASSEHTFFLLPPEPPLNTPIDGYAYEGFPKLRKELFPIKEPNRVLPPEFSTPQKQKGSGSGTPGSPLARRSKHEVKSAQKMASKHYQTPNLWAKCMLSTCFSLWFAHLPAFITVHTQKGRVLDLAFHILQRMQKQSLSHHDEVCYRVMMQLCGIYSKPVLAVKTLCGMRNAGIIPNAITYGYYNRALLESKWNPSNLLWNKLRNVLLGVSAFRQCGIERSNRRKSLLALDDIDKLSADATDSTSRISIESVASLESQSASQFKTDTLSSDPGYCSISENCELVNVSPTSNVTATPYNEVDVSRSESSFSLSPVQANTPTHAASNLSSPSSCDTSYSSPTATVAYDTAPSSPVLPIYPPLSLSGSILPSATINLGLPLMNNHISPIVPSQNMDSLDSSSPLSKISISNLTTGQISSHSNIQLGSNDSSLVTSSLNYDASLSRPIEVNGVPLKIIPKNNSLTRCNTLDFTHSDELRKRLGSIVRTSSAGFSSGVQLSLLETHPLLVNSAGLLMTSPLDASYLDPKRLSRPRPSDLAEALSETLEKYDQIQEPSMPLPANFELYHADRCPPENIKSNINMYGNDGKIVKKLLNLVYPLDDQETTCENIKESSEKKTYGIISEKKTDKVSKIPETERSLKSRTFKTSRKENMRVNVADEKCIKVVNDFVDESDEEEKRDSHAHNQLNNSGTKTFFARNTPERISSLWKRGMLGADERLRGIWKKNPSRSSSKETLKEDSPEKTNGESGQIYSNSLSKDKKLPKRISPVKDNVKENIQVQKLIKSEKPRDSSLNVSQLISFEESPSPPLALMKVQMPCTPILTGEELVKGSGRHTVLSGDPLGALNKPSLGVNKELFPTVLTQSLMSDPLGVFDDDSDIQMTNDKSLLNCSYSQKPPLPFDASNRRKSNTLTPSGSAKSRISRSNTFTSISSANPSIGDDTRSLSSSNLFSAPFSGEEFRSVSDSLINRSDIDLNTDEALSSGLWVAPFKLPLSGSSTFGLASSVATQGLRQATKHIGTLRTQYLDPAMIELANQSNFNYRKNELISGSLSSMRSAVTSLSKKYNIIREAIIATPSKQGWRPDDAEEDSVDGFWSRRESYESSLNQTTEEPLRCPPLLGDTDPGGGIIVDRSLPSSWSLAGPFCLGVWITSCSRCHNCQGILYDEEIMAGWRPDDSNLNTRCWHCEKVTVPFLTVSVYYLRHLAKPSMEKNISATKPTKEEASPSSQSSTERSKSSRGQSRKSTTEETIAYIQEKGMQLDPLTVPYLSPLVLRKELETVLGHDGDTCLTLPSFPDHHPILYWNMLWYFSRLRLPSHLSGLCLSSLSVLKDKAVHDTWKEADWRHVYVRCLWDNTIYHKELGAPLYMQWKENYLPSTLINALTPHRSKVPKSVLESYLTLLHFNQVGRCLELMIQTLRKRPAELKYNHFPVYRDLFFFALTAVPRNELNTIAFEREFRREFEKLLPTNSKILKEGDGPPHLPAVFCRKFFWDLSL